MTIREIVARHVRVLLKRTIRHASFSRSETDSLIVCCRLSDGTEGWGEGVPRPYVTGETIGTALEQLESTDLQSQLGGTLDGLDEALDRLGRLQLAGTDSDQRDCFGNSVRCALELSLLDAVARAAGVPLSDVTERVPEAAPVRARNERIRYSAALTSMSPVKQIISACKYRLYGFAQCKVKVGVDGIDDAATLRRVRSILGPGVDLRLDANEAWRCGEVLSNMMPLLPFRVSSLEQPVPHEEVAGLREVRKQLPTPIMLDESLCSLRDARRAVDEGWGDLFNIRLSKCGGFVNSLRLAALAGEAGLGYQLGCQVGETGILSAAGRHFAASVANIRYHEGSYDRHLVQERLTVEDITFGYGGEAPALPGPGLGIEVDRDALERVTVRTVTLPIDL